MSVFPNLVRLAKSWVDRSEDGNPLGDLRVLLVDVGSIPRRGGGSESKYLY